jgi:hypothetical protein
VECIIHRYWIGFSRKKGANRSEVIPRRGHQRMSYGYGGPVMAGRTLAGGRPNGRLNLTFVYGNLFYCALLIARIHHIRKSGLGIRRDESPHYTCFVSRPRGPRKVPSLALCHGRERGCLYCIDTFRFRGAMWRIDKR